MITDWLLIIQILLPNSLALGIVITKQLRAFFDGFTDLPFSVQIFFDKIYNDINPQTTRQLDLWESQFALPYSGLTTQQRRDRLSGAWKAHGGQSPRYIQDTLHDAGFDVYVHPWWEPIPGRPGGGSVNGDVTPVARDPFLYLDDGTAKLYSMADGLPSAEDGHQNGVLPGIIVAQDGGLVEAFGYPLVNLGSGETYTMPVDPSTYPHYLYIASENFPIPGSVAQSRRDEFEALLLKICPLQIWIGVIVSYS